MKHHPDPNSNATPDRSNSIMYTYAKNDHPLFRFQSTKLRSWLIGYPRILALHRTYLATIDPDTFEVTNTFSYHSIRQWKALPSNKNSNSDKDVDVGSMNNANAIEVAQIEILEKDGSATKLKFKLAERAKFLTEFYLCS